MKKKDARTTTHQWALHQEVTLYDCVAKAEKENRTLYSALQQASEILPRSYNACRDHWAKMRKMIQAGKWSIDQARAAINHEEEKVVPETNNVTEASKSAIGFSERLAKTIETLEAELEKVDAERHRIATAINALKAI